MLHSNSNWCPITDDFCHQRSGFAGIIQLETLALIEREIGLGIPVQQFFDLIVGTRYVLVGQRLKVLC